MTTVVNTKRDDYDVYIGRPSLWGNPFSHKSYASVSVVLATREDAVKAYEDWLRGTDWTMHRPGQRKWILEHLHELKGKRLGCWCSPKVCHGDVLARMADELEETE